MLSDAPRPSIDGQGGSHVKIGGGTNTENGDGSRTSHMHAVHRGVRRDVNCILPACRWEQPGQGKKRKNLVNSTVPQIVRTKPTNREGEDSAIPPGAKKSQIDAYTHQRSRFHDERLGMHAQSDITTHNDDQQVSCPWCSRTAPTGNARSHGACGHT